MNGMASAVVQAVQAEREVGVREAHGVTADVKLCVPTGQPPAGGGGYNTGGGGEAEGGGGEEEGVVQEASVVNAVYETPAVIAPIAWAVMQSPSVATSVGDTPA